MVRSSRSFFVYSKIVLEWSQLGGVMPVIVIVWKSWNTALWNYCGMCLISTPWKFSGPGALWLGRGRKASLKTAGVSLLMIMCWGGEGVAGIASSQGNAPFGSTLGSGEREVVSFFSTIFITLRNDSLQVPCQSPEVQIVFECWVLVCWGCYMRRI